MPSGSENVTHELQRVNLWLCEHQRQAASDQARGNAANLANFATTLAMFVGIGEREHTT